MPEQDFITNANIGLGLFFQYGLLLFVVLYFIFSLMVVRQVQLMAETLVTEGEGIIKALSIVHAIFALLIVILFIGFLPIF